MMASAPPAGDTHNPLAGSDPFADGGQDSHIADIFGFEPEEPGEGTPPATSGGDATDSVPVASPPSNPTEDGPNPSSAGSSVGAGEGEAGGALEGAPPAEPTPPAPTPPSEEKLALTALQQQVERLTRELEDAKKPATPDATSQPATDPAAPPAPVNIKLPDTLRDAITSGDDDQMLGALDSIVSGLATQIQQVAHLTLSQIGELRKLVEGGAGTGSPTAAPSAQTDDLEATRTKMQNDYFAKFPAHKGSEFQPILAAVATEMASQYPGHPWNDDYINSMGARVAERAKALAKAMNPGSVSTPPAPLQPGPRSATSGAELQDIGDEVLDVLKSW